MGTKVSIVILTYNNYDLLHQMLMDVKRNCSDADEVVVVDNGSEDDNVQRGLEFWLGLHILPLKIVEFVKNRGFVVGMNYGISKATGDIIIALSNDVKILTNTFVSEVKEHFKTNDKKLIGQTLYTQNTGWNVFGGKTIPYVEGYCMIASKKFWKSHELDEIYSPSDYEDVHLSMQAVKDGYELVQLRPGMLHHLGGRTFGYSPEREERTRKNRKTFAKYWGLDETE